MNFYPLGLSLLSWLVYCCHRYNLLSIWSENALEDDVSCCCWVSHEGSTAALHQLSNLKRGLTLTCLGIGQGRAAGDTLLFCFLWICLQEATWMAQKFNKGLVPFNSLGRNIGPSDAAGTWKCPRGSWKWWGFRMQDRPVRFSSPFILLNPTSGDLPWRWEGRRRANLAPRKADTLQVYVPQFCVGQLPRSYWTRKRPGVAASPL